MLMPLTVNACKNISEIGGGGDSMLGTKGHDDGCVSGGKKVGGEVGSGRVRHNSHIGLVWSSGDNAVACLLMLY